MTQPTPYSQAFDFSDYTDSNPNTPQQGVRIDTELAALKITTDEILANLALIQRDDTALVNDSVGIDQLKAEVSLGINAVTTWATTTSYIVNAAVWNDTKLYRCLVSHTSGTFSTDLGNSYWEELVDFKTPVDAAAASATSAATDASDADTARIAAEAAKVLAEDAKDDAETAKAAAEAAAAGIYWKEPVVVATTANITLSGEQTIDGVLTSADRVLVKDQTAPEENGIYVSDAAGWSRANPLDTWGEHVGASVIATQGATYADSSWICTVDPSGTLGATAITWASFGGGDMKAANDLNEVNPATARGNIDVPQKVATTVDNHIVRNTGTTGEQQASGVTIDDDDNLSGQGADQNAQTGTAHTVTAADNGKIIYLNNAAAITVTIPQTSTESIPAGFWCTFAQEGAGQVTIAPEGSDAINSKDGLLSLTGQYSGATIHKRTAGSPNTWFLIGDLA